MKQAVILSLALVMPIGIFIFLKTLGKNEFDVAPLHQQGLLPVSVECGVDYKTPYTISSSVLEELQWSAADSLTLYVFGHGDLDERAVTLRLKDSFTINELQLHKVSADSLAAAGGEDSEPIIKDAVTIEQLKECFFILEKDKNAVLVDRQRRIRGYYDLGKRDDLDRLAVELKIILKKY